MKRFKHHCMEASQQLYEKSYSWHHFIPEERGSEAQERKTSLSILCLTLGRKRTIGPLYLLRIPKSADAQVPHIKWHGICK